MGTNAEDMIKKAISEEIVEEMFRDMGFYVVKLGKEYAVSPLAQLEDFINRCTNDTGMFQLQKPNKESISAVDYVNRLPDFIVVDKFGTIALIEVKYRYNGVPWEEDKEVFEVYDKAVLLVVNCYYDHKDYPDQSVKLDAVQGLRNSRFHIWQLEENGEIIAPCTLEEWLKGRNIEKSDIIGRYEHFVHKWLDIVRTWEREQKEDINRNQMKL